MYFTICYCVSVLPGRAAWEKFSVEEVLGSVQLESLVEIFQKEHITMDVLVEMTNDDLQSIGVTAFGHRHKILRRVKELTCSEEEIGTMSCTCVSSVCVHKHASIVVVFGVVSVITAVCLWFTADTSPVPPPGPPEPVGVASAEHAGTQLIELLHSDKDFIAVSEEVCVALCLPLSAPFHDMYIYLLVWSHFRCRTLFVLIATTAKLEESSSPMRLLK